MNTRIQKLSFTLEKNILLSLGAGFIVFAFAYTYFLILSISAVVAREEFVYKTQILSEKVATLEQQYLFASNAITEHYAFDQGYVPVSRRTFVERGTLTLGTLGNAR